MQELVVSGTDPIDSGEAFECQIAPKCLLCCCHNGSTETATGLIAPSWTFRRHSPVDFDRTIGSEKLLTQYHVILLGKSIPPMSVYNYISITLAS